MKRRDRSSPPDDTAKAEAKRIRKATRASKWEAREREERVRQQVEAAWVRAWASGVAPT